MANETKSPSPPITSIGFGAYRVSQRFSEHCQALTDALRAGVNVIDTSTNYADGESERAIGEIVSGLVATGEINRDELTIISKVGYLQGANLAQAKKMKAAGSPHSEVTELTRDLWHCLSPEFITSQITESLERLDGVGIDVLLLHNPEYFLKHSNDHREYYRRIEAAFYHLESEVKAGRIREYGVSSNTFTEDVTHPEFTSLQVLVDFADSIGERHNGTHHFKWIQFPLNLAENNAFTLINQPTGTLIEVAKQNGLQTLVNRPLNAFTPDHLLRLRSYRNYHALDLESALQKAMDLTLAREAQFPAELGKAPRLWGHVLHAQFKQILDIEHWLEYRHRRIEPELRTLQERVGDHAWWQDYQPALTALLETITAWQEKRAAERNERLRFKLVEAVPTLREWKSLSQTVIQIYRSLPGIDCVLVGMRTPAYVSDVTALLKSKKIEPADAVIAMEAGQHFLEEHFEKPAVTP